MTFWLVFHFVVGLLGTWAARRYALRANLVDQPGPRRSHAAPTPRGGGIAIVVSILAAIIWLTIEYPDRSIGLYCLAASLTIVAGIGWIDDHRPLSVGIRLAAHVAAALVLAWGLQQTYGNPWLSLGACLLAIGLTNAWNFLDGIDGLAASQAALIAAAVSLAGVGAEQWLAAAVAAACCGFLPMNFPKARIFLGDVGSGALGFSLAALIAGAAGGQQDSGRLLILLPLAALLVDTGLTLATRVLRGEQWWTAHVQHAYQVWARRLHAHVPVTLAYGLWTSIACMLWLVFGSADVAFITPSLLAWYIATTLFWLYLRRRPKCAPKGIKE